MALNSAVLHSDGKRIIVKEIIADGTNLVSLSELTKVDDAIVVSKGGAQTIYVNSGQQGASGDTEIGITVVSSSGTADSGGGISGHVLSVWAIGN